jgi:hypothetical protein
MFFQQAFGTIVRNKARLSFRGSMDSGNPESSTPLYISFCFRICMIMNMYEHLLNVRNIQIYLRFKYILYSHLSLIWFIQKVYSVVRKFCTQMTKTYLMQSVCLQHHNRKGNDKIGEKQFQKKRRKVRHFTHM